MQYVFSFQFSEIMVPMSRRVPALKNSFWRGVERLLFNLSTPLKVTKTNFRNENGSTKR